MTKTITSNQAMGEIGEAAVRLRFLNIGFQFDGRSRLEAGIDGIAEVMDNGKPLARMIAVQVKSTSQGLYSSENDKGFYYLIRTSDLEYWRGSNLPVILVLYRQKDDSFYWKEVPHDLTDGERRLQFDKQVDRLDRDSVDRLAALTVPKAGFGYYVPPLGGGEEALVNILPITLPSEIYVATTPYTPSKAIATLLDGEEQARFDWVIRGGRFLSFHDPRTSACREIVDEDQVEAIETDFFAFHDEEDERHIFSHLLRDTLRHQFREDLWWSKSRKLFYFCALEEGVARTYYYESSKKKTDADVVNVVRSKTDPDRIDFVRHHAFVPRFELLAGQWYLVINPSYYFTTNGFKPHLHPAALLAGKKRMDNSSALRGQVIMWHRFLSAKQLEKGDLFNAAPVREPGLIFGTPPTIELSTRVPEDVWGKPKRKAEDVEEEEGLLV
ncbi:MAG: DUF4365 domain-containing protein [Sphingorhabdus sp.]|uniref:DUF4365 domain-containing protein n=1 Tax=Sphingomonadales TaxID=204457 RepID=UPI0032B82D02